MLTFKLSMAKQRTWTGRQSANSPSCGSTAEKSAASGVLWSIPETGSIPGMSPSMEEQSAMSPDLPTRQTYTHKHIGDCMGLSSLVTPSLTALP